jgi:hypothetical protein
VHEKVLKYRSYTWMHVETEKLKEFFLLDELKKQEYRHYKK